MVTVVNNPSGNDRVIEVDRGDSSAGWAVAVIILLVLVAVGAYAWMHYYRTPATQQAPNASINVTLPSAGYQPSSDTSGAGGNASQAPATQ